MMPQQIRCRCESNPTFRLCMGRGSYPYEPGPRGWMPFTCPTCEGSGAVTKEGESAQECPTCRRAGTIDPANPPLGVFAKLRKTFLGG